MEDWLRRRGDLGHREMRDSSQEAQVGNGFAGLWSLWSGARGGRGLSWPQEPVGKAMAKVRLEVK